MITIRGDDVIVRTRGRDRADGYRFLANVKMTEATDLLRLILLAGPLFEAPNQQHQREHLNLVALLRLMHRALRSAGQSYVSADPAGGAPKLHANDK